MLLNIAAVVSPGHVFVFGGVRQGFCLASRIFMLAEGVAASAIFMHKEKTLHMAKTAPRD
jgi:hypothetical protein